MNIVDQLEQLAHQEPFQPFTIRVAGGGKHRINHPEYLGFSPRKKTVLVWTETDVAIFINPTLISEVEEHARNRK